MRGAVLAVAAIAVATIVFTVATRDPEEPRSIAIVVIAFTTATAALAVRLLAGPEPKSKRASSTLPGPALRRGLLIGVAAGGVAFLRVVDGLTPFTVAFLLLALAGAEYVVSGRRVRSRR